MKKHDAFAPNPESGKGVAKLAKLPLANGHSKFTASYWLPRVFQPTYSNRDGEKRLVKQWYARIKYGDERKAVGLGTNIRKEAATVAGNFYKAVVGRGWEAALGELSPDKAPKKGVPTVGQFLAEVEKLGGLNPRTLRGYSVSLRWIAGRAFGVKATQDRFDYKGGGTQRWRDRIDRVSLDELTPKRVAHVITSFAAAVGSNPVAQQKARRSANSIARQARALFSKKLLKKLSFEPFKNPFEGVDIEGARAVRYNGTVNATSLLRDGRAELASEDPEAYKALLLALGAGLRKREIDNLTWPQIDFDQSVVRIQTTETFVAKTSDSEGSVYIDAGLIDELKKLKGDSKGSFVLESKLKPKPESRHAYYRAAFTFDRLTKWLRKKGVTSHKPVHTLRKEFGAIINESADIYTASRQLRHSNISTTAAYYVDNRKKVTVPIGAMLAPGNTTSEAPKAKENLE